MSLRQGSSLLIAPVKALQGLCDEGRMSEVDTETLLTFAKMRHDFKSANLAQLFATDAHATVHSGR